ncbi:MAG: PAS domain S-box protein [Acidobacteria bacterium]|nr:PAS domain S-box protein [Acidobacteriota bacterium]
MGDPDRNTYQLILDSVAEGTIAVDENGNTILFNAAAARILRNGASGTKPAEWARTAGLYLPDMVTPYPPEQIPLARAVRGEAVDEAEIFIRHPGVHQGVWVLVNARPIRDSNGALRGGVMVLRDIGERKRAEEQVRFQASLLDQVRNSVIATDKTGRIVYWNKFAEILHQWTCKEVVGKTFTELPVPMIEPEIMSRILAEAERSGCFAGEVLTRRKDGTILPILISVSALRNVKGEVIGAVGVALDLSERKKAEEELKASREQLRRLAARLQSVREAERTSVARDIHDDLGQWLTAARMELCRLVPKLADTCKDGSCSALAADLQESVNLLDCAIRMVQRISTQLRPGVLDDLGLPAAVEWQAGEFQSRTGIQCVITATHSDFTLGRIGSTAIFRIFQEILTNIARHANARTVEISLRRYAGHLVLRVKDDGCGITAEQAADPKALGLLGMRERALAIGGELFINGSPGRGTTVRLTVPLERASRARTRFPRRDRKGGATRDAYPDCR